MNRRLFIAINLPEEAREGIYARLSRKIPAEGCKIVGMGNLHITLAFLGYVAEEDIAQIGGKMQGLAELNKKPFEVVLGGIGEFNSRVIWLGARSGGEEIAQIAEKLNALLGMQDERFHPHVTLARNKNLKSAEVRSLVLALGKENYSAGFIVGSIDLMESVLRPAGPEYSRVFGFGL